MGKCGISRIKEQHSSVAHRDDCGKRKFALEGSRTLVKLDRCSLLVFKAFLSFVSPLALSQKKGRET